MRPGRSHPGNQFNQQAAAPRPRQAEVKTSLLRHLERPIERLERTLFSVSKMTQRLVGRPSDEEWRAWRTAGRNGIWQRSEQQQLGRTFPRRCSRSGKPSMPCIRSANIRRGEIQRSSGRLRPVEALQQASPGSWHVQNSGCRSKGLQDLPHLAAQLQVDC